MTAAKFQPIRTLMAKDWRLFRVPVIGLLVGGAISYLLALIAILADSHDIWAHHQAAVNALVNALIGGTLAASALTSLLASVFGGAAIAGERSERTSDFLGLLPVTRKQIVISKLVVSALILCGCAGLYGMIALLAFRLGATQPFLSWTAIASHSVAWLGYTVSFFGVGWLLSTFSSSGPISACASMAVTVVSATLVAAAANRDFRSVWEMMTVCATVMFAIGITCVIAGALYFVRRVAP